MKQTHTKIYVHRLIAIFCIVCICVSFFSPLSALAAFNKQINYQGKLTTASGVAVTNGTYNMEFKLYTASSGGSVVWTETRTGGNKVTITNGLFSVLLGSVTSFSGVDFNQTLYLGVNIGGSGSPSWDGEMTPRKTLGAVPAAIESERVGGFTPSQSPTGNQIPVLTSGDLVFAGNANLGGGLTLGAVSNASSNTNKFLVSDSGVVKYRSGSQLLSDIGGQAALTFSGPLSQSGNTVSIAQSNTSTSGYLSSTDWNTFNGKQNALPTYTAGSILFGNGTSTPAQNNSNFFWDNAVNSLGIGTASPNAKIDTQTTYGGVNAFRAGIMSTNAANNDLLTVASDGGLYSSSVFDDGSGSVHNFTKLESDQDGSFSINGYVNYGTPSYGNQSFQINPTGELYNYGNINDGNGGAFQFQKFYSAANGSLNIQTAGVDNNGNTQSGDVLNINNTGDFSLYSNLFTNSSGNYQQNQTLTIDKNGQLNLYGIYDDAIGNIIQNTTLAINKLGDTTFYGTTDSGGGNINQQQTFAITHQGSLTAGFIDPAVGGSITSTGTGSVAFGFGSGGEIRSESHGSLAFGKAVDSGSQILATNQGAMAFGYATGGSTIQAGGNNALAFGYGQDSGQLYAEQSSLVFGEVAGSSSLVKSNNQASLVFGQANNSGQILSNSASSLAFGYADNGQILTGDTGSFAHGYVDNSAVINAAATGSTAMGYGTSSATIYANSGAFAVGRADDSGSLTADAEGSFVLGYVSGSSSSLLSSGNGAFISGYADSGGVLTSSANGTVAQGYVGDSGHITASGNGAFAHGSAIANSAITASGNGSHAFGITDSNGIITASGNGAFAGGSAVTDPYKILATGVGSFAFGSAEDGDVSADGTASFAFGDNVQVSTDARYSGVFGQNGVVSNKVNQFLFALGGATTTLGSDHTFAVGYDGTLLFKVDTTAISASSLSGSGTRMVVADSSGTLSTQSIPSGSTGTVTSFGFTNSNGFSGTVSNSTTTPTLSLSLQNATTSQSGQLTSTDWNTFNNKQAALTFSTGLTNTTNTITNNLSTGVLGGQSIVGGTASGNSLTLSSTSNATKGKILFGNSAYDEANNFLGIGTTTPGASVDVAAGTTALNSVVNATGSINDFLQFNIQNTSTGTHAQSGYSATADNGSPTTGFAWMGINNSTFNFPTAYNIGGANDVSFIGSGQDLYLANANNTKSIIFSTGTATTPFFAERMRITSAGNVGIATASPSSLFSVGSSSQFQVNSSGAIAAATGITSSGTITLSGLSTGIAHLSSGGVVSSSAVALGGSDVSGTLPIANGGTGQATANAAFNALSPMTTGGDLIYGGTSGAATRLANGTSGQVLTSAGTTAAPTWTTLVTGVSSVFGRTGAVVAANGDYTASQIPLSTFTSGAGAVSSSDSVLQAIQKINGNVGALVTGVSSVSNSDSTLTISPTTGAVVASLNLGHANTWTATQTFTPAANTNALAVTGYSLTSTNAQSLIDLAGTWNTSGSPNAINLALTNTASGTTASFFNVTVGGTQIFNVSKTGGIKMGSSSSVGIFNVDQTYASAANGAQLALYSNTTTVAAYGLYYAGGSAITYTSGTGGGLSVGNNFSPTSGTGVFNAQIIQPLINQTGGASGITRGLYINPTLTASADFRAIEVLAAGGTQLRLGYDTSNYVKYVVGSTNSLTITPGTASTSGVNYTKTDGTTSILNIDTSNAGVSIGTTSLNSGEKLTINGNSGIGKASSSGGVGYAAVYDNSTGYVGFQQRGNAAASNAGAGALTGGSEILSFNTGGLGIYTNNGTPLVFGTNGTERIRILSGGNVGIGTTSSGASLEIKPSTSNGSLAFKTGDSSGNNILTVDDGGSSGIYGRAYINNRTVTYTASVTGKPMLSVSPTVVNNNASSNNTLQMVDISPSVTDNNPITAGTSTNDYMLRVGPSYNSSSGNDVSFNNSILINPAWNTTGATGSFRNVTSTAVNYAATFDRTNFGTLTLNGFVYAPVISNYNGTVAGRGFYYNPTLSSNNGAVLSGTAWENTSGDALFGTTSGNVGIGVSSTSARLHIKGTDTSASTASLRIDDSTNTSLFKVFNDGSAFLNYTVSYSSGSPTTPSFNINPSVTDVTSPTVTYNFFNVSPTVSTNHSLSATNAIMKIAPSLTASATADLSNTTPATGTAMLAITPSVTSFRNVNLTGIRYNPTITNSSNQYLTSFANIPTISGSTAAGTNYVRGFYSQFTVSGSATPADLVSFYADNAVISSGSSAAQVGLYINDLTTATNNWGIFESSTNTKNQFAGNVGIGTNLTTAQASSLTAKLHVISTAEQFRLGYDTTNYVKYTVGSTNSLTITPGVASTSGVNWTKTDGTTSILNIDTTNARVGIGTTSPSNMLHVASSTATTALASFDTTRTVSSNGSTVPAGITISPTITDTSNANNTVIELIKVAPTIATASAFNGLSALVNFAPTFSSNTANLDSNTNNLVVIAPTFNNGSSSWRHVNGRALYINPTITGITGTNAYRALEITNGAVALNTTSGNTAIGSTGATSLFQVTQPTTAVGTVTNTAAGTTVTGTGTQFTNTFKVGDSITIGGQTVTISSVNSDTNLSTAAITNANTAAAYTLTGGTRFAINGNGNIGIGTTIPSVRFHLKGFDTSYATTGFRIDDSSNNSLLTISNEGQLALDRSITYTALNTTAPFLSVSPTITDTNASNNTRYTMAQFSPTVSHTATVSSANIVRISPSYTTSTSGINTNVTMLSAAPTFTGEYNLTTTGFSFAPTLTNTVNNILGLTGISITPTISGTNPANGSILTGVLYNPTLGTTQINSNTAWKNTSGDVLFGTTSGNVAIGTTSASSLFQVNQPTTGPGTVTNTAGSTTVSWTSSTNSGASPQFTNTFKVGDSITVGGQTVTISAIASDTSMTVSPAITNANTYASYTLTGGNLFAVKGNGFVGIGTTTPSSKLNIISTAEQFRLGYDTTNYVKYTVGSTNSLTITPGVASTSGVNWTKTDGTTSILNIDTTNARVGIGTTSPGGLLDIRSSTASAAAQVASTLSTGFSQFVMGANDGTAPTIHNLSFNASATGTTFGLSRAGLGLIYADGTALTAMAIGTNNSSTPLVFGTNSAEAVRIDTSGNMGIGTGATVSAKLHIISTTEQFRLGYDTSNYVKFTLSAANSLNIVPGTGSANGFNFKKSDGTTSILDIDTVNTRVGIANSTPTYTLDVGTSSVSGVVAQFTNSTGSCTINPTISSVGCTSDIRLKKNITSLREGVPFNLTTIQTTVTDTLLQKISLLTPVTYNWNSELDTDSKHTGFIAQQVEQVFPELVATDATTGFKTLNYMGFAPYTIKAIQELNLKVTPIIPDGLDAGAYAKIKEFLQGIAQESKAVVDTVIAKKVQTQELCIGDTTDSVCVTKDQLRVLLQNTTTTTSGAIPTITTTIIPDVPAPTVPVSNPVVTPNPTTAPITTQQLDAPVTSSAISTPDPVPVQATQQNP